MKYYKYTFQKYKKYSQRQICNFLRKMFNISPLEESEVNLALQVIHVYIKSLWICVFHCLLNGSIGTKVKYTGQSFSFSYFWHMLWVCSTLCNLLMGCELWFVLRQMPVWCHSNHSQFPVLGSPRMKRVSEKFFTALLFNKSRLERL